MLFEPIRFDPIRFETIRFEPIRFEPISFEPIRIEPIRFEPIRFESTGTRLGSKGMTSVQWTWIRMMDMDSKIVDSNDGHGLEDSGFE